MTQSTTLIKAGKILDTVGAMQSNMTRVGQRIAGFILATPDKVTRLSIADLSQEVDVGEASIIRFCRTMGYKGFQDFKMDLAIELATTDSQDSNTLLDAEISDTDDAHTIGLKLQSTINNVLSETLNLLDMHQVEQVVEALHTSRMIAIFGVGSSGVTATEMKHKLMRIGLQVDAETNNHFMYMQAALLKAGDVAIGISHSGDAPETVHALKLAKQSGAVTVALTHNLGSPVSDAADFCLINGNRQGRLQGDSLGTKTAQLFVLDLIYTLLVQKDPERAMTNKLRTMDALCGQK
ncbi:MurR/RpiR family transcriptional regulator [Shimwellia blattae]|uniref:Transcriptional regulator n=1 Tax=Shimwellia blattae (strain ATCC 29907 / DSM 4481 / JCM 1650 / NBRC 105725 / CDC 9005-74) TaxID=630626 RepID=I2B944_SHIBC|nr:MurR/RpiR family transcriptional regulator [Shimwellia blattae]AFJ47048.1 transcriptional regulator [Shimwellia blattae DSM 4481 = NBRC 105725]GAB80830.1 putative RpiR family transcriptional regulator [Shimwellia blattae DSM 4481 = NBRC 105725]VDY64541.1 MurPQ operon repressor [Shimwellia blattae]VEC22649.1 MurPQ operon repressor [Shimwellia blattae]